MKCQVYKREEFIHFSAKTIAGFVPDDDWWPQWWWQHLWKTLIYFIRNYTSWTHIPVNVCECCESSICIIITPRNSQQLASMSEFHITCHLLCWASGGATNSLSHVHIMCISHIWSHADPMPNCIRSITKKYWLL